MPTLSSDATSIESLLLEFKHQRHSLRISVSNLAALVGFHPYKQVPELVQQLVYQGSIGRVLLQQDAELLGLTFVTPQEQLQQIAQKAGPATQQALAQALTKTSDSVEAARVIKQTVVTEATKTGRLQATELKVLQEGVRSAVDTMHGTWHEDAALDAYEQKTGWPVRERNAQVKAWPFERSSRGDVLTVEPTGQACCFYLNRRDTTAIDETNEAEREDKEAKRPKVIDLTDDNSDDEKNKVAELEQKAGPTAVKIDAESAKDTPFFLLLGSIDGLRDELAPNAAREDDDSWVLRPIVVECKHRMNRIHKVPPLYEQIQTIAYCFMYETEHADILQVMRRDVAVKGRRARQPAVGVDEAIENDTTSAKSNNAAKSPCTQRLLTDCFGIKGRDLGQESAVSAVATVIAPSEGTVTMTEAQIMFCETKGVVESYDQLGALESEHTALPACSEVDVDQSIDPVEEKSSVGNGISQDAHSDSLPMASESTHLPSEGHSTTATPKRRPSPLTVSISRISLDDPIFQHRTQWHEVLLPRLRSIIDAIYNIRVDDGKRYQLLSSLATQDGSVPRAAWRVLFDECEWMEDCDTAFSWDAPNRS